MNSLKIKNYLSKNQRIQYMDIKYISECMQMERRYVRLKIYQYRKNKINSLNNLRYFKNYQALRENMRVLKAFYRYAEMTRLYHKMKREYLKQVDV